MTRVTDVLFKITNPSIFYRLLVLQTAFIAFITLYFVCTEEDTTMESTPPEFPSLNGVTEASPEVRPTKHYYESYVTSADTFSNLYPALVECFGIILLGYMAGRFRFLSEAEAKGLSVFVGTFSLPALIFGNLITLDMASVNWNFLLGIFAAKAVVFLAVLIVTALIGRR